MPPVNFPNSFFVALVFTTDTGSRGFAVCSGTGTRSARPMNDSMEIVKS